MKIWTIRIVSFLLTVTMMVVIFRFSADTGEESGKQSGEITKEVLETFDITEETKSPAEYEKIFNTSDLLLRKLAHFTEYLFLALFFAVFMQSVLKRRGLALGIATGCSILYAISDEMHQMFVDGRGPAVLDVGIDSAGALLGIFFAMLLGKLLFKVKKNSQSV